jgi:uncharacterized protein involved in type VI secretion and phage assembly
MMYSVANWLAAGHEEHHRMLGVTVGIVTNNQDPDGLARVKVRFPWLGDNDESFWARLVMPMAGKGRGLYLLPEVDDEVLVAFEHGAMDHAYVLGALWNGDDNPPESNGDGHNNLRTLKSRSGHLIRLDDSEGAEKIEIIDKTGNNRITIQSSDNTLHIESDSDIKIKSSSGKVVLSGMGIELQSRAGVSIQGDENIDIKANAQLDLKGSLVNIN